MRRHEQARRAFDGIERDARVIRRGRHECVVVDAQHDHRAILSLLADRASDAARDESDWARDALSEGLVVYYCRGPGWPLVACHTHAQWDEAQARGYLHTS